MIQRHCSTLKKISWKNVQTCNFQVGAGTQKIFELGNLVFFILNLNRWSYFCANMSKFGAKKILLLILLLKNFEGHVTWLMYFCIKSKAYAVILSHRRITTELRLIKLFWLCDIRILVEDACWSSFSEK